MEKDYTDVYILKGGWGEWTKKNFPVEKKGIRPAEDGQSTTGTTEEEKP